LWCSSDGEALQAAPSQASCSPMSAMMNFDPTALTNKFSALNSSSSVPSDN
jgi:hypothetical protein